MPWKCSAGDHEHVKAPLTMTVQKQHVMKIYVVKVEFQPVLQHSLKMLISNNYPR